MVYKEKTKYGEIKIDKGIIAQLIRDSVKPYLLRVKSSVDKSFSVSSKGIFINITVSISLGESISLVCEGIINFLSKAIIEDLQLLVDDIIVNVESVYTQKGNISPREITVKFSERISDTNKH